MESRFKLTVKTNDYTVECHITAQQARDIEVIGLDAYPSLKVTIQNEFYQATNKHLMNFRYTLDIIEIKS